MTTKSSGKPTHPKKIVLASSSPRRSELLSPFFKLEIIAPEISESRRSAESPLKYVERIAKEKCHEVQKRVFAHGQIKIIVACDTTVALGDKIFGKAASQDHAKKILKALSGRCHKVLSSVCVGYSIPQNPSYLVTTTTKVWFRKLSDDEIQKYLRSNEWRGKAGAYAVQGGALSFIEKIEGSLTSVVGLPLEETLELIRRVAAL